MQLWSASSLYFRMMATLAVRVEAAGHARRTRPRDYDIEMANPSGSEMRLIQPSRFKTERAVTTDTKIQPST